MYIFVYRRFKFVRFATAGNIASKVAMKYNYIERERER